ncbi:MAG TPA: glutamine synthetase III [Spirochaetales bacterium]|nr:glutamine synthetase III [Spirochaetales bacterium]HRZ64760.1 glutamine synthetase III [Spirochaetia bacterium]
MNGATERGSIDLALLYGSNCFSNTVMRERLPKSVFAELLLAQQGKRELTLEIAEVVASAMRDWALERGATHYTHWFHPLSGISAEKHESFVAPIGDGRVIMEFSGKELVKGEPDASSFPSGGLRATFEARGYTAWDVTSPAFLKKAPSGTTLCVPTAFVSYFGHALDKKVPLLRSMEALQRSALRVLKALGFEDIKRVTATVGPEQEYFLVKRELYEKRPDLILAGRTVFGALPAKGQEMEDHYYGIVEEKVLAFMRELNEELWTLGVPAKTQHNEVAPNQFELAVVFQTANVAADHNQLVMETLSKVAARHGMAALLHEKPFANLNGSGKHLNWSMATDTGVNLLEPGSDPASDARFLLFVSAVIEAVDRYAPQLRASVATAGNDNRLGGHEAPPAIISVFLGDQLAEVLGAAAEGRACAACEGGRLEIGTATLPKLPRDLGDRNRTSPFAFTGNKFEFRMVGSSQSAATPCAVLNAAVAKVLGEFADRLEKAANRGDFALEISEIIAGSYKAHRRVVFNGNGYSEEWRREAEKRGLPSFRSAVDVIPEFASAAGVELFSSQGVFTKDEVESRCVIYLEKYAKQVNIEAGVMIDMARRSIFPAATACVEDLARAAAALAAVGAASQAQELRARKLAELSGAVAEEADKLEKALAGAQEIEEPLAQAKSYREQVVPRMNALREKVDLLEKSVDKARWPFPGYQELLFSL